MKKHILLVILIFGITQLIQAQKKDKYLWLEDVEGKKALEFVNAQNKTTEKKLTKEKDYQQIFDDCLAAYNSDERIAYPSILGKHVFNFWKDKKYVRGIWRRCLLENYKNGNPDWEILLDLDELSKKDNVKWVFKGTRGLYPDYNRFLIRLSKGGGDAVVTKEFDVNKKQFIKNGFFIDESKNSASYVDKNTIIISANFGKNTLTDSGYPRQTKIWKRGTQLKDAQLIYEGKKEDVGVWGSVLRDGENAFNLIYQSLTMFTSVKMIWMDNKIIKLDIPNDASINNILNNQLIVKLKSDWKVNAKTYKTGSLLSLNFAELLKGNKKINLIIEPDEFSSISEVVRTKNKLIIDLMTNVSSQLYIYTFSNGKWISEKVNSPDFGTISIVASDEHSDQYFFDFKNFLTPTTLYYADANKNIFKHYKSLPAFFDASKYEIKQYKTKSKDGTMIPYFLVASKDIKYDGTNPTLLYAYGGFEISISPSYSATIGISWLDKGGVYALANIRGGGEFGPKWHQDGLKEKRQNVYDDLFAVSEDLINKKITSPKHLGVRGGSNGGLLVGVAFTQRPDLYNAVVCAVPLLDMRRYNTLLAGASWMGEYGNPDIPEEWEYIKKYSPYHNLKKGVDYPEVFFTTSTRDDRVHPGHARKMVAKMNDMGYKTYYYENTEGGHVGSSTNEQSAKSSALTYSYLMMKLK